MTVPNPEAMLAELREHPHSKPLARAVGERLVATGREKDVLSFSKPGAEALAKELADLDEESASTPFGNPIIVLRSGARTPADRALLAALLALDLRDALPSAPESELETACILTRLATRAGLPVFDFVDSALSEPGAAALWRAAAAIAKDPEGSDDDLGDAEALIATAGLAESSSTAARRALDEVRRGAKSKLVVALAESSNAEAPLPLAGELAPAPRSTIWTLALSVTLLLPLWHLLRLIARFAFGYQRPAELLLGDRGLELRTTTQFLGRVLRERNVLVPLANLVRVTREVRFARVGMYAGLTALFIGSYFGMGFFIDGLRVPGGSLPLLGVALVIVIGGLALDFGLSALGDDVRGRCRIVVVPRRGRKLCVSRLDRAEADRMLAAIANRAQVDAPDSAEPQPVARTAAS